MFVNAYGAQCASVKVTCTDLAERRRRGLRSFPLRSEASVSERRICQYGILQLFSSSSVSASPRLQTPLLPMPRCLFSVRPWLRSRRKIEPQDIAHLPDGVFVVGNVLSAFAGSLGMFAVARFVSGMPQGAYFCAAAVVATISWDGATVARLLPLSWEA